MRLRNSLRPGNCLKIALDPCNQAGFSAATPRREFRARLNQCLAAVKCAPR